MSPKRKKPPLTAAERSEAISRGHNKDGNAWRLAALNLELLGMGVMEISRQLKQSPNTISRFLRSTGATLMRREIFGASSIEEIKEELRSVWPLALRAVTELLQSTDPDLVVQRASKGLEILIALGAKEADKIEVTEKLIIEAAREAIIVAAAEAQKKEDEEAITVGNA